jgi:glycerophosphoryl diester phosphodiesterase
MMRLFLALTFVLAATSLHAQNQVDKIRREFLNPISRTVLVASHRAVHHLFAENSIPAIEQAIRLGIDIVEIDIQVSKDGIPMLMHDSRLDRTTNGKGNLEDQNYDDLRKLRLIVNKKITEESIPTLEEVLKVVKGRILVDLDLKTRRIENVIEVIKRNHSEDIVFFFDSDYEILSRVTSASKKFMLMPRAYSYAMADSALNLFSPQVVHIDLKFDSKEVCDLIKAKHSRIWINALGEPDVKIRQGKEKEAIEALLKNGANIIQTDEPEKWKKVLQKSGLHW